ncbi:MAG: hypothetical protein ACXWQZ_15755, partial [Ktedonobacterales bacterium]
MTRTIEIGILTRNGPVRGFLYPVPHARDGIILIGSESDLFGPAAIFEELALYLQGAGFTLLQIGAPHPHSLSGYTYDILGALSALHTWDVERVALVLWSSYEPDNEPDAMLGGKKKISGADAVARVVDTIVGLVGVVVGVATIIGKPRHKVSQREQTPHLRLVHSTSAGSQASLGSQSRSAPVSTFRIDEDLPRRLTIQLGDNAELSRHAAPLIAKLYTWCRSTLHETEMPLERQPVLLSRDLDTTARLAYSSHASNAALLPDTITTHHSEPQTFTGIQLWLDQQWEDILTSLDARNPAGSLKIRQVATAMPKLGPGHSTHMAGHVWPLLDFAARAEWLQICQQAHYCI